MIIVIDLLTIFILAFLRIVKLTISHEGVGNSLYMRKTSHFDVLTARLGRMPMPRWAVSDE